MAFTTVTPNNTSWTSADEVTSPSWSGVTSISSPSWSLISSITIPDWDSSEEGDFTVGQNSYFIESTIGTKDWGYFRRPAQDHNWEEQTSLNWEDYA